MTIGTFITGFSTKFLEPTLFENAFFEVDVWSFLHLILFIIIGKYVKLPFRFIVVGIFLFETTEFILARFTNFFDESLKDTFTDILIDFIGYFIGIML